MPCPTNNQEYMGKREGLSKVILKAMGIFGGVQVLTILCSIIRTKLVALWIGPLGVGLFGIYNQALVQSENSCVIMIRPVKGTSTDGPLPRREGALRYERL